ncbi:cysteine-rich with EGF-like domain-containing protein 2 [Salpingoeca rosetta]|uniref:Cysteine-rich with EGF-like domain-containing protein 2 n=1 Tax=Salpingoeca rosetta (strain ATCC 50818 / BSB-021) TaxID=946362 RepID=F2U8D0_SALR5|nr:cysteine-rich with EGF-like domain-containing protein 2 [Salpingoeca rosetta]EGD72638.1 cysteine-rich with EGF-like domain-containing protein 2 [Salpingoeca rosetta]|eukprot:XP_004994461.1 cysteine-rich with EGF-like domain-containing protein 2 [Salpingoeca rosetta]
MVMVMMPRRGCRSRIGGAAVVVLALLLACGLEGVRADAKCHTCKSLVSRFVKGMDRTKADGFGGGNTDWEERSLGAYATSETRLQEILEDTCESSKDHSCHMQLEQAEETIEDWWYDRCDGDAEDTLREMVCEKALRVCCPNGRYGPKCKPCPGGAENPCSGHGRCKGEGTTSGSGKCTCHTGYKGKSCNKCKKGFYAVDEANGDEDSSSTTTNAITCLKCNPACTACTGPGTSSCTKCAEGYVYEEGNGCVDVDECAAGTFKCAGDQYCHNTPGNYTCRSCHACDPSAGCDGAGPGACRACAPGYRMKGGDGAGCADVDECEEQGDSVCAEGNKVCTNTQGSFDCTCPQGTREVDGACVDDNDSEAQQEGDDKKSPGHDEL